MGHGLTKLMKKHWRSWDFVQVYRQTWEQQHLLTTWYHRLSGDWQVAGSLQGTGWILPARSQLKRLHSALCRVLPADLTIACSTGCARTQIGRAC